MNKREWKGLFILVAILVSLPILGYFYKHFTREDDKGKPELNGLFDLRLGMTVDELKSVVDTTLLQEFGFDDSLWRGGALKEKQLRRFYLSKYVIDDGYSIEAIYLEFSENKLYEILTTEYNKKTEELLTQKYGSPDKEYGKFVGQWHDTKSWWTSKPFRITCGSNMVTNSDNTFDSYRLYVRDMKVSNQASKSVYRFWDEIREKAQKQIEIENQPLIDKL